MSLNLRDLSCLNYGMGMSHWGYRTNDTRRELEGASYWKDAIPCFNIGDFIFVHHRTHGNAIYCVGPLGQVRCLVEWPEPAANELDQLREKVQTLTELVEKIHKRLKVEDLA